ncbi:GNAT family N-acetyltransferase [Amorphus orientalis]|uniref:Acetyltransferase n=1 Tax=Amorphus orientalis TaxID=649198 RepID=A0AAE3VTD1_9HYPH|nr:N-acetyltransferase [Amorphus orientalis]MDQ0317241.1 putative acetyltransferase [Amorphus orientalis]
MIIRDAQDGDLDAVLEVERRAFGQDDEADLVRRVLADPSADPVLSLVAVDGDRIEGHVLFSAARVETGTTGLPASMLAPLAVDPDHQRTGIGSRLVEAGLDRLRQAGCGLVFVFGDPAYYGRFGFEPAMAAGFPPPCPIATEHADAWQVVRLAPEVGGGEGGRVVCADSFMVPALWAV